MNWIRKQLTMTLICVSFLGFFLLSCSNNVELIDEIGYSNIVVSNNTLWFGAGYKLYRINLDTLSANEVYRTDNIVIDIIALDDNKVYFGGHPSPRGNKGTLWSLNQNNEEIVWKREFRDRWSGGYFATPVLIEDDVLIIGTRTSLHRIDKNTGDTIWEIKKNWFGTGELLRPLLVNETLYYGIANDYFGGDESLSDRTIAITNPLSGEIQRTIMMPGKIGGIPAIHGNCLYIKDRQFKEQATSNQKELRLYCLDIKSYDIVWVFQRYGYPRSSSIAFYDNLAFDIIENQLFAIDVQTGDPRWNSPKLDNSASNPQIIEDVNLIAIEIVDNNELLFLDLLTGNPQYIINDVYTSPIFLDEEAIFGTIDAIISANIYTGNINWSIPVDNIYQETISND